MQQLRHLSVLTVIWQLTPSHPSHTPCKESSSCSAHAGRFPRPQPGISFPRSDAVNAAARQQELPRLFYVVPARPVLLVAEPIHSPSQAGLSILAVPHCIMDPHEQLVRTYTGALLLRRQMMSNKSELTLRQLFAPMRRLTASCTHVNGQSRPIH